MSSELFINESALETRLAVKHNNEINALYIERHANPSLVGNIYYGKVVRVLSGIQAAFVDIGLDKNAWLNLADIERESHQNPHNEQASITDLLRQGQMIEVQVIKDALGEKGAQVSTRIHLASRHLVFTPYNPTLSVSKRIGSEALKQQLIQWLQPYCSFYNGNLYNSDLDNSDLNKGDRGGFVIRTQAQNFDQDQSYDQDQLSKKAQLIKEAQWLKSRWQELCDTLQSTVKNKPTAKQKPQCIYQDLPLALRFIRDELNDDIAQIHLDCPKLAQEIQRVSQQFFPLLANKITLHSEDVGLFESQGIEFAIEQALSAQVPLASGGYLVIEQTEAMTTIDINTGSFVGEKSTEQTFLSINLEAVKEVAKQIRLRQLSGMILIDCIGTMNASQKKSIKKTLEQALKRDRTKTKVYGFTALGLLEMTRQRTRNALEQNLLIRCPICEGSGSVNSMETAASHLMRELHSLANQYSHAQLIVCVSPAFNEWIKHNRLLDVAAGAFKKRVSIRVSSMTHPTQFNIVME